VGHHLISTCLSAAPNPEALPVGFDDNAEFDAAYLAFGYRPGRPDLVAAQGALVLHQLRPVVVHVYQLDILARAVMAVHDVCRISRDPEQTPYGRGLPGIFFL
jgi:hypothetical protein